MIKSLERIGPTSSLDNKMWKVKQLSHESS